MAAEAANISSCSMAADIDSTTPAASSHGKPFLESLEFVESGKKESDSQSLESSSSKSSTLAAAGSRESTTTALFLHGYGQNERLVLKNAKRLVEKLTKTGIRCRSLAGPIVLPVREDQQLGDARAWWTFPGLDMNNMDWELAERSTKDGVEASMKLLLQELADDSTIATVYAFSQGATLVASAVAAGGLMDVAPHVKTIVLVSGPNDPAVPDTVDLAPASFRMMFVLGQQDEVINIDRARKLAAKFPRATVIEHSKGHVTMPSDAATRNAITDFILFPHQSQVGKLPVSVASHKQKVK